jgi:cytochrome c oxidase subunit II
VNRKTFPLLLSCLGLALIAAQARAEPGPTTAQQLYFSCTSCHGERGEGSEAIHAPAIAGQHPAYLSRQLRHFRDGLRGRHPQDTYGRQMALMAANLQSDEEIDILASYVASFPAPPAAATGDTVSEKGAALYASCAACHGPNGSGNASLMSPRIGGLERLYIATQLRNYSRSVRAYSPKDTAGQQMRAALGALGTEADIEAVSAYVSNLSGRPD